MPRNVTKDRCASSVDSAASKTGSKGMGTGAGFQPVNYRPGEKEIYSTRGKSKK